jgi:hypothetical protein
MSLAFLAVMLLSMMLIPSSNAQGITLDGELSETDWILWFEDTDESGFTVHHATDEYNVYLGIVFEDDDSSNDHLQFAYKADGVDYKIKIKHDTIICYRPSDGSNEGWWSRTVWGLPPGVEITKGTTDDKTSYEMCIAKSTLGEYANDFPNNFTVWIMYITDNPDGCINYYPNVYAEWWWVVNQGTGGGEREHIPEFHIPETPYGTILSLATMTGVFLLLTKGDKHVQL